MVVDVPRRAAELAIQLIALDYRSSGIYTTMGSIGALHKPRFDKFMTHTCSIQTEPYTSPGVARIAVYSIP